MLLLLTKQNYFAYDRVVDLIQVLIGLSLNGGINAHTILQFGVPLYLSCSLFSEE